MHRSCRRVLKSPHLYSSICSSPPLSLLSASNVVTTLNITRNLVGTCISSAWGCPRNLVEHHLCQGRQPGWLVQTTSHWYQRNMAVSALFMLVRAFALSSTYPIDYFSSPPPISIDTTDSLVVHATNSIDQPATLHHHGMFFNSTSWMDGALAVSQW